MKKIIIVCVVASILSACENWISKPAYGENEMILLLPSPDKRFELKIYQGPPEDSIMVDDYVVGEVYFCKKESVSHNSDMIYFKNHETYESAYWVNDTCVVINGNKIDILNKDTWINEP